MGSEKPKENIAVVGAHHTPARRQVQDSSLEEMIFEAATGALADAGISIADIDAVVLSTTDQVEGRVIESMVTTGAAGGAGRDVTTVTSSGEHAFAYAHLRMLAGQARRVLVVVWSKESEGTDPVHADWLNAEPFVLRRLGMTSTVAAGLQASAYRARHGIDADAVRRLRTARWDAARDAHAVERPGEGRLMAWPLTANDLPVGCDMACAAVVAQRSVVSSDQQPAWITGVGWVTDRYDLGERDLSRFAALQAAVEMALDGRGSLADVDVVELQEISTVASFAACEALGLAPPGQGALVCTAERPIINPSGGSLPVNPGNASGFMRILSAAQQVRGRAGAVQLDPVPRTAAAAALHGFAGQGAAVVTFASQEEAV
jgi:acetyl-CoA C-acetyltransferase